jgi:hypothetical protein
MAERTDEYRQRIQALRRMAKASKYVEEAKLFEQLADFYERQMAEEKNGGRQDKDTP